MKQLMIILICTMSVVVLRAQNWEKTAYSAFKKEYSNLLLNQPKSWFSTKVRTSVFADVNDAAAKEVTTAHFRLFDENNYAFETNGMIQIQKDKLKLDIDTVERQVVLSKSIPAELTMFKSDQFDRIDSTRYEFFSMNKGNRRLLRVTEKVQLSAMKSLYFEFEKNILQKVEIYYWPTNFTSNNLDDESTEQPMVRLEYSESKSFAKDQELEKLVAKWLHYDSKQKIYSCPDKNYTFYDLLTTK